MKKEDTIRRAIGGIDDDLIVGAEKAVGEKTVKTSWIKWGSIAAAFVLVIALGAFVLPGLFKNSDPVIPDTPSANENSDGNHENVFEKGYTYSVDEGKYAAYVQGKVIADKYVGEKLEDVTVTAGWVDGYGKRLTEEHAGAEIYAIEGVSSDVAVAIRFTDELEAELTTCYYVILNPAADLTPVQPWVITYEDPGMLDGETVEE